MALPQQGTETCVLELNFILNLVLMALPQQGTETYSIFFKTKEDIFMVLMALPQQGTETVLLTYLLLFQQT